ncbi:MAG TPA: hypothetical protein VJV22_09025 [Acidobacteriaceae bacterium]|nr:hypothetical protein [Acidobacteriaceae bacterium]
MPVSVRTGTAGGSSAEPVPSSPLLTGFAVLEDCGFAGAGVFAWLAALDTGAFDGAAAFVCPGALAGAVGFAGPAALAGGAAVFA